MRTSRFHQDTQSGQAWPEPMHFSSRNSVFAHDKVINPSYQRCVSGGGLTLITRWRRLIFARVAFTSIGRREVCASVRPLHGPELRALRPLQGSGPYVFVTEAGTPVTTAWFLRTVQRTGRAAKLPLPVHPHMLRQPTGYKLANDGPDTRSLGHFLGHRNLRSTARYAALAEGRFARFWQDQRGGACPPKDKAAFDKHYVEKHIPLAKKIPGLRKYEVSQGPVATPAGPSQYHLVAVLQYDNLAAIQAAFASPEGRATVADVQTMATGGSDIIMFDTHPV
jgi:uncharacterized protein (TIGR02118 family)